MSEIIRSAKKKIMETNKKVELLVCAMNEAERNSCGGSELREAIPLAYELIGYLTCMVKSDEPFDFEDASYIYHKLNKIGNAIWYTNEYGSGSQALKNVLHTAIDMDNEFGHIMSLMTDKAKNNRESEGNNNE